MRIAILGSTQFKDMFYRHERVLLKEGHEVRKPAFDDHEELDELGVCKHNLEIIKWADRIDIIWDQRSNGFIFDFGMLFALDKPIKIVYLEPKTLTGVLRKYADSKEI